MDTDTIVSETCMHTHMQTKPKQNVTPTKNNALASLLLTLIVKTFAHFFSVNIRELEKLSLF